MNEVSVSQQPVQAEAVRFVIDKENRLYLHIIDMISVVWDLNYESARKVWTRAQNTDERLAKAQRIFRNFGGKVFFPYSQAYLAYRHIVRTRTRDRRRQDPELLHLWNDTLISIRARLDPFPANTRRNFCLRSLPVEPLVIGQEPAPNPPRMLELYISSSEEEDSEPELDLECAAEDDEHKPLLRRSAKPSSASLSPSPPSALLHSVMRSDEAAVYDSLAAQVARSQGLQLNLEEFKATTEQIHVLGTRRKLPPEKKKE